MISMKITVGQYTRKHGNALVYDIATMEGALRLVDRVALDGINPAQFIAQINAAPAYVQKLHSVQTARAQLVNKLKYHGAAA
jgi:hypothetical protein